MNAKHAWTTIQCGRQCFIKGELGFNQLPYWLMQIIELEAWREFDPGVGGIVRHDNFSQFLQAPPVAGWGTTPKVLTAMIQSNPEWKAETEEGRALKQLVTELRRLTTRSRGRPDLKHDNIMNKSEQGTGVGYTLHILARDHPGEHAEVLAGKKSPYAAAVDAGIRRRYVQCRSDDPARAVATLLKVYTKEDIRRALDELP